MSVRAIIIGLLMATGLCCVTFFNEAVMRQSVLVGNYLPVSVYGTLILSIVILNPLLKRLRPGWKFEGRELAVILTLVLAACGVAESGLLKTFANVLILPHHHVKSNPAWKAEGTWDRLPEGMLVDPGEKDEVLAGFLQGKVGTEPLAFNEVPWGSWAGPLLVWLPIIVLLIVGFIGLGLVVHRQWSEHEKLPYPVATFAQSLWGGKEKGHESVLLHRGFWVAAGTVCALHMINFAHSWWPDHMIQIPTQFSFWSLKEIFPTFAKGRLAWGLLNIRVYFSVIGFAYLVSSDVALSFAVVPFIGTVIDGVLAGYGISVGAGGEHRASIYTSLNLGSFFAFVAMIIFFGRRHYISAARVALGLSSSDDIKPYEVWGMRVFFGSSLLTVILMIAYGLPWPFAVVYMLSIMVFYVAVSRIVAETGLFFMKPAWVPHIMLLGLFGGYSLGPTAALVAMIFSAVLFAEAREAVMPYMVNSFNMLSREKVKLGRMAVWSAGAIFIGLTAGFIVTLYLQYNHGADLATSRWFHTVVPSYPYEISTDISQRLKSQGLLEQSDQMSSFWRIFAIRPETKFAVSFIVGALLVLGCYLGRLRIRGWPIHPAVFLVWSWYHCSKLTFSFFLGWAIKTAVTKYGGWKMVQTVKPIMIGLIAGEMLGAFIPTVISALYYFISGELPPRFYIVP